MHTLPIVNHMPQNLSLGSVVVCTSTCLAPVSSRDVPLLKKTLAILEYPGLMCLEEIGWGVHYVVMEHCSF